MSEEGKNEEANEHGIEYDILGREVKLSVIDPLESFISLFITLLVWKVWTVWFEAPLEMILLIWVIAHYTSEVKVKTSFHKD